MTASAKQHASKGEKCEHASKGEGYGVEGERAHLGSALAVVPCPKGSHASRHEERRRDVGEVRRDACDQSLGNQSGLVPVVIKGQSAAISGNQSAIRASAIRAASYLGGCPVRGGMGLRSDRSGGAARGWPCDAPPLPAAASASGGSLPAVAVSAAASTTGGVSAGGMGGSTRPLGGVSDGLDPFGGSPSFPLTPRRRGCLVEAAMISAAVKSNGCRSGDTCTASVRRGGMQSGAVGGVHGAVACVLTVRS